MCEKKRQSLRPECLLCNFLNDDITGRMCRCVSSVSYLRDDGVVIVKSYSYGHSGPRD